MKIITELLPECETPHDTAVFLDIDKKARFTGRTDILMELDRIAELRSPDDRPKIVEAMEAIIGQLTGKR